MDDGNPVDIPSVIRSAAVANGVDPAYLLATGQSESGLNPDAANPNSTATGLFQFTAPTWKQYGGDADPTDPVANANAAARFTADNAKTLTAAGIQPTPSSLYLAHFSGAPTAIRVMQADPTASAADVLGPAATKANPFIANMSVADLRNWAAGKGGSSSTPSASAASAVGPPLSIMPNTPAPSAPPAGPLGLLNNPTAFSAPASPPASAPAPAQSARPSPLSPPPALPQGTPAAAAMRAKLLASIFGQ
jgi:hypothetical protein